MIQHKEIESNGGRFMEYDRKQDGRVNGNHHPVISMFEHAWTVPLRAGGKEWRDR